MNTKNIPKIILVIGLITFLFSGCSTSTPKVENSEIKIETDIPPSTATTETILEETIEDEFLPEEDVEIGELI